MTKSESKKKEKNNLASLCYQHHLHLSSFICLANGFIESAASTVSEDIKPLEIFSNHL